VYPLLGASLNGWQFIATDADATNVDYASANVARNNFTDKIKGKDFVCGSLMSFASVELLYTLCLKQPTPKTIWHTGSSARK